MNLTQEWSINQPSARQLESEVEAVLEHFYASRSWFRRPGILERTLVDQLENVLAAGKQVTNAIGIKLHKTNQSWGTRNGPLYH